MTNQPWQRLLKRLSHLRRYRGSPSESCRRDRPGLRPCEFQPIGFCRRSTHQTRRFTRSEVNERRKDRIRIWTRSEPQTNAEGKRQRFSRRTHTESAKTDRDRDIDVKHRRLLPSSVRRCMATNKPASRKSLLLDRFALLELDAALYLT